MKTAPHIDRVDDIGEMLLNYFHTAYVHEVCGGHETRALLEEERQTRSWKK